MIVAQGQYNLRNKYINQKTDDVLYYLSLHFIGNKILRTTLPLRGIFQVLSVTLKLGTSVAV